MLSLRTLPIARTTAVAAVALISATLIWYFLSLRQTETRDVSAGTSQAPANSRPAQGLAQPPASNERTNVAPTRATPRDSREWTRLLVDTLVARGDAQSLSAAAILMGANALDFIDATDPTNNRVDFDRRRAALVLQAAKAAPNDAAIQALALSSCTALENCDPATFENRLAAIDAANGWTAIPALRRALAAADPEKQAAILQEMARTQHFDNYRARMETIVSDALRTLDIPSPPDAHWDDTPPMQRLLAQTMNVSVPGDGYADLFKACGRPAPEAVLQDCRTVAKLMFESDDDSVARDGLELARAFARPGSAEAATFDEAQRKYDWQVYQAILLPRSPEQNARFVKDRLGDAQLRRELLQEHGVPLEPPANWVSPFRQHE